MTRLLKLAAVIGIGVVALLATTRESSASGCIVSPCSNHHIFFCCGSSCGSRTC